MSAVLVLASGGLDSTTLVFDLIADGLDVQPLFFDYGQHCVEKEWATLSRVLPASCRTPLKYNISDIFRGSKSRLILEPDLWRDAVASEDLYIPYRTLLFFSMGAAIAQTIGYDKVYSAFINSNYVKELDCTAQFLNSMDALSQSIGPVRFILPYRNCTKSEVARRSAKLGVPIGATFSCQVFSDTPCGVCPNCVERINAIKEVGI